MNELQQAIGQYVLYRLVLRRREPDRELFLAVPQDVVETVFRDECGRAFLQEEQGKVFGFDFRYWSASFANAPVFTRIRKSIRR